MATIGSWWVSSHESRPDETVVGSYYVNHLRSDRRPLGGKLYLTNQRLLFSPHLVDALLGGEKFGIELEDVDRVTRIRADGDEDGTESGGPERLALERGDGRRDTFVVSDLETAIDDVREQLETDDAERSQ